MKANDESRHFLSNEDVADLRLIRMMKDYADKGYNVELKKAPGGGYKVFRVKKQIIA